MYRRSQEQIQMWIIATAMCILFTIDGSHTSSVSRNLPCEFYDSINITDGQYADSDGVIVHDGITYKPNQYAKVNYIWEYGKTKKLADEHLRGCICNIKKCVRMCCPYGEVFNLDDKRCESHEFTKNYNHFIQNEMGGIEEVALNEHFSLVNGKPCEKISEAKNYTIRHTGDVFSEDVKYNHMEYCVLTMLNKETNTTEFKLMFCVETKDKPTDTSKFEILPYVMLISVVFIIATFFVYFFFPELCNMYEKCLLCYLFALVVGYTLMAAVQLNGHNDMEALPCKAMGYTIYFSFLAAFLWLSVISFNLWFVFRSKNAFKSLSERKRLERKRFGLYQIYAWGLAFILTLVAAILDSSESKLKPGIGDGTCFMKNVHLTQGLFFYLPSAIIFSVNIVFYVLTALKIRQDPMKEYTSNEERSTNQKKANFVSALRLFIIMGITWSMEAISFYISKDGKQFLLTDILNSLHGFAIFVLFILLKRDVLNLIKNRWRQITGKPITNGSSTTNSILDTRRSNHRLN